MKTREDAEKELAELDKTGGQAFPIIGGTAEYHYGMTLRDYFAAKAMQGMNANPELLQAVTSGGIRDGSAFQRMAKKAYEQADAMLSARNC